MVALFFQRLKAHAHSEMDLRRWFHDAARRIDLSQATTQPTQTNTTDQQIFLHSTYHPSTPARSYIRQAFNEHLRKPLMINNNTSGGVLGPTRLTIAYSR